MNKSIRLLRLISISLGAIAAILLILASTGCATFTGAWLTPDAQALFDKAIARLEQHLDKPTKPTPTPTDPTAPTPTTPTTPTPPKTAVDEVSYDSLVWAHGGFNGSKARLDPIVRIKSLSYDRSNLYYQWAAGDGILLGAKNSEDAGATLACMFYKAVDGRWIGGKFDWIRPRNLSRPLHHINGSDPYDTWGSASIPNPADACFVIVSVRTGTRTNIIKSKWSR